MAIELSAKYHEARAAYDTARTDEERLTCMLAMRAELEATLRAAAELPTIPPGIKEAWAAFLRDLPQLLKEHRRKWVLYHRTNRLVIGNDDHELYAEAVRRGLPEREIGIWCIEPQARVESIGCALYTTESPMQRDPVH